MAVRASPAWPHRQTCSGHPRPRNDPPDIRVHGQDRFSLVGRAIDQARQDEALRRPRGIQPVEARPVALPRPCLPMCHQRRGVALQPLQQPRRSGRQRIDIDLAHRCGWMIGLVAVGVEDFANEPIGPVVDAGNRIGDVVSWQVAAGDEAIFGAPSTINSGCARARASTAARRGSVPARPLANSATRCTPVPGSTSSSPSILGVQDCTAASKIGPS